MKKIVFLITLILLSSFTINVKAESYNFYVGNRVDNIWMNKYNSKDGTTQSVYIMELHRSDNHEFVYCIDPFANFNESATYNEIERPNNLTPTQIQDITLYTFFGYGYESHQSKEWYGATQLLIWQTTNPNDNFYISDTRYGTDNHKYDTKIAEIKALAAPYQKNISFNKQKIDAIKGETIVLYDTNNVLINFSNYNKNLTIDNNKLTVLTPKEGDIKYEFKKSIKKYDKKMLFYHTSDGQGLINIGDPPDIINDLTIRVKTNTITFQKKSSKELNYPNNATILGSVFELLDSNDNLVETINFDTTDIKTYTNLKFGKYKLREIKAGPGYELNTNIIEIEITTEKKDYLFVLENTPIEKIIRIKKSYGTDNNFKPEKDISFNIYLYDELVDTIKTDENGEAEITLPYGEYKIVQLTTTEGYQKIDPIIVNIDSIEPITYDLKDYKIEVPDTYSNINIFKLIINFIKNILCIV